MTASTLPQAGVYRLPDGNRIVVGAVEGDRIRARAGGWGQHRYLRADELRRLLQGAERLPTERR